jgi:hypothetical protein
MRHTTVDYLRNSNEIRILDIMERIIILKIKVIDFVTNFSSIVWGCYRQPPAAQPPNSCKYLYYIYPIDMRVKYPNKSKMINGCSF